MRKRDQAKFDLGIKLVREYGFKQKEAASLAGLHYLTLSKYLKQQLIEDQAKALANKKVYSPLPAYTAFPPSFIRQLTKQELMCGKANGYGAQKVSA